LVRNYSTSLIRKGSELKTGGNVMKKPRIIVVFAALLVSCVLIGTQADFGVCEEQPTYYVKIEKTVDQNAVTLALGQTIYVTYEIVVKISTEEPAGCYQLLNTGDTVIVFDPAYSGEIPVATISYGAELGQHVYQYKSTVGPYDVCGEYTVTNQAFLLYNPAGETLGPCFVTASVAVSVPCAVSELSDEECTLTPGYWKTHSEYGPAPYDDTWSLLGDGADTDFFGTGQTYYEVLWTKPKGGNAYYILAHAYIAAELNLSNGASMPSMIHDAWNQAGVLLEKYGEDSSIPKRSPDRNLAIELAEMLTAYNNGYVGPGHCPNQQ
jgi:hypothetical protein